MKKIFIFILCIVCLLASLAVPVSGAVYTPENLEADVAYLVSLDDGTVIVDVNSDKRVSPASITKIVTAILTIENCTDFGYVITAPAYCIRLLDGTNSSTAGILVGEELSVTDLLYCLLVYSANDAANILADYIGGGDINTFVGMMNDFVQSLGCTDTHFVNAHGLDDPDHYTTAKDLATIYKYCISNSMFAEIAGTYSYDIPPTNEYVYTRYLRNTNGMLNPGISDYYYEYCKTGKTGTTDSAGRCVISTASRDGYNYLCVIMNAEFYDMDEDGVNENMAFIESKRLYEWTFENIRLREVANTSSYVGEVKVNIAKDFDYVSLSPAENVSALVPCGVTAESVLIEPIESKTLAETDAPVKKGDVLGRASIKYAGQTVAEVDLVASFSVDRSTVKYILSLVKAFLHSTVFKIILIAAVGLAVLAVLLKIRNGGGKKSSKKDEIKIVKFNPKK